MSILYHLVKDNQCTNTGQNVKFLLNEYDFNEISELFENKHMIKKARVNPLLENENWKVQVIEEICLVKLVFLTTDLEINILEDILESLAVD